MTTPPLTLTDASGETLDAFVTPAGRLGITVEEDKPATVVLARDQALQLLGWLGQALAVDPCHLPSCRHVPEPTIEHLGYVRCARCTVLFDPVTGHHCAATDDEQVRGWLVADATVAHVEGQPQP
jgi:hypothetical protein